MKWKLHLEWFSPSLRRQLLQISPLYIVREEREREIKERDEHSKSSVEICFLSRIWSVLISWWWRPIFLPKYMRRLVSFFRACAMVPWFWHIMIWGRYGRQLCLLIFAFSSWKSTDVWQIDIPLPGVCREDIISIYGRRWYSLFFSLHLYLEPTHSPHISTNSPSQWRESYSHCISLCSPSSLLTSPFISPPKQ